MSQQQLSDETSPFDGRYFEIYHGKSMFIGRKSLELVKILQEYIARNDLMGIPSPCHYDLVKQWLYKLFCTSWVGNESHATEHTRLFSFGDGRVSSS
jgi:hypothetical protein